MAAAAGVAVEDLLLDALAIADERMASAIRDVSTREGFDPRAHALVAFGGAGGQHACRIAELLGIEKILAPEDASLLSARGLLGARDERFAERQILRRLDGIAASDWRALWTELESRARAALTADGVPDSEIEVARRLVRMRLVGQESTLDISLSPRHELGELEPAFERAYREVFGDSPPERAREIESIRLVAATVEVGERRKKKKGFRGEKSRATIPVPSRVFRQTARPEGSLQNRLSPVPPPAVRQRLACVRRRGGSRFRCWTAALSFPPAEPAR